jgi:copper chaperone CopZ
MFRDNLKAAMSIGLVLLCGFTSLAQMQKAEIKATGLTCSMCSNAINKQLKAMSGVNTVTTDLNTNSFFVAFENNNTITPKMLKDAVEKAGFFIGSLELTLSAADLKKKESSYVLLDEFVSNNTVDTKVKVYDKGYVTQKEFKKMQKEFSKIATYALDNEEDYHIKRVL